MELYKQNLERVKQPKFFDLWFDERLTWAVTIQNVINKCRKVLNIMRCLVRRDCGADRLSLGSIY